MKYPLTKIAKKVYTLSVEAYLVLQHMMCNLFVETHFSMNKTHNRFRFFGKYMLYRELYSNDQRNGKCSKYIKERNKEGMSHTSYGILILDSVSYIYFGKR